MGKVNVETNLARIQLVYGNLLDVFSIVNSSVADPSTAEGAHERDREHRIVSKGEEIRGSSLPALLQYSLSRHQGDVVPRRPKCVGVVQSTEITSLPITKFAVLHDSK